MFKHTKTNLLLLVARKVAISFRFVLVLVLLSVGILYTRAGAPERAYAATASTLNFQARLLQSSGAIVGDGTYNVEFKLYDASSGGTAIWTETRTGANKVTVKGGYLSVYLGDVTALPSGGWDQERFLTLNIGGTGSPVWDGEMNPRLRLTAVPYAFQAQRAEGLEKLIGSFTGTLNFAGTLGQNTVYTLPDPGQASVNICLSSGNCAGQGGSVSGSGTMGRLSYFDTINGNNLADSWLFQNSGSSTLELDSSRNLSLLGGNLSVTGNGSFTGNLTVGDGAGDTLTINGTAVSIPNGLNVDANTFVIDSTTNRVGIGDATPAAALTVGDGDLFQVNSSGAIAAATGITSSGTITFSALGTGIVTANSSGVLSSGSLDRNSATYFTGTMSVANGGTGATTFTSNGIVYGNGTGALQSTAAGANSVLITSGANVPSLSQTLPTAVQGNITSVGTLTSGSIASGFGTISTANNITTTAALQGGSLNITGNGTIGGTLDVQGASINIGTTTQQGSLILNDGSLNTATLLSAALGQNTVYTLPDVGNAAATVCVTYGAGLSNCFAAGNQVDSVNSLQGDLTITGTANEIEVTDNGTDTITIGLPDDVTITSNLTVTDLATFNGGIAIANNGNFSQTGTGTFSTGTGAVTLNGATSVSGSNTFTVGTGLTTLGGGLTATGTTNINTSGTAATLIGNTSATLTLNGSSIVLGTATVTRTAAGTTTFDLVDAANTTLAVTNSGVGNANLTVDGSGTFAGGLSVTSGGASITGNSTIAGTLTGLTGLTSSGTITFSGLTTDGVVTVTGGVLGSTSTLSVANGGTGASTLTANGILYGNGTSAIQATTAAANSVLVTDGSNVPSLSQTLPTAVQSNITATGALDAGSITSGFGAIDVGTDAISTTGTISAGTLTISGNATISGTLDVTGLATFSGGLTVTNGDQLTNAGSTLFTAVAISNLPTGGSIGSAATTVDAATTFNVNQTTTGQTLTLPTPTDTTAGRIIYINNIGTANFTMGGVLISSGRAQGFIWTGSAWTGAGIDSAGDGANQIGVIDSQTKSANGAVITNNTLYLQTADATFPGLVSTGSQTFAGAKTFNGQIIAGAGINLGTQTLQGTTAIIDFSNFDVDASGNTDVAGTFTSGTANAFTINASGAITAATGITSSGTITFSGLGAGLVQSSAGGALSSGAVDRNSATFFNSTLSVANGGTGASTLTANGILYGNGTSAIQATTAAANSVLVTDGSNVPSLSQTLPTAVQGNITSVGALTSGSIASGFGTISTANNITTTATLSGGTLSVTNNATIGGDIVVSGGQLTVGTAAGQAGSFILYDGGSAGTENTLTIDVDSGLAQNTVISFPDPGQATAEVCYRNDNNCGFALTSGSGNYVQFTPSSAQVDNNAFASIYINDTGGGNLLHLQSGGTDRFIVDNSGNVTVGGDLAVNGGDITSTTSLNVTASNGALTFTSTGATSDIILNSGRNIELQDNTNVTGNLDVSGTLAVGATNGFTVDASGAITAATGIVSSGTIQFSVLSTGVVTANGTGVIASGTLDRNSSTYFTGTLSVANGGTGATTFNTNGVLYYNGTTQVSTTAAANSILITNGSNVPSLSQTLPLAVQANITQTGALDAGSITSGFGSIDVGADAISTTGTLSGGTLNVSGNATVSGAFNAEGNTTIGDANTDTLTVTAVLQGGSPLVFEGATADANELTLAIAALTGDRTITLPDETGTVCLQNSANCGFAIASGSGAYVQFTPSSAQSDASANASIFINDTGGGNLLHMQVSGADRFVVDNSGNLVMAGDLRVNGNDIQDSAGTTRITLGATNAITGNLTATGNADFEGTLTAGTSNAFQVSSSGAVTAVGVNSGTGLIQGTGGLTVTGTTNINATGSASTNIGNTGSVLTLTGIGINLNTSLLNRVAAGTTSLNLNDTANTTFSIVNTGTGVANLTVDGNIDVAGTFTAGTADAFQINASGQLTAGSITSGFGSIDVGADAISTTGTVTGGIVDATTGFRINGGATTGNYLRGNGTNFVASALLASDLSGTIFSSAADSGAGTFVTGDTISIQGGTNGIDTSLTGDTFTLNLDYTEIGDAVFGNNSDVAIVWGFDPTGATNPNFTFADDSITLTAATVTLSGDLRVNGNDIQDSAGTTRITLGATNTITGNASITANLSVDGNTTLGNAAGDTLTINGTAVSIPNNLNIDTNTLYIDATNNRVGIGTGAPGESLHVVNAANAISMVQTTSGTGAYALQAFRTADRQYRIGVATSSETLFGVANKFFLFDSTANAVRFVIDTAGNMGLGDVSPDAKLEVLATTEQLRLTHTDDTVDSRFTVDASGNLSIDNTGTKTVIVDDLQVTGNDLLDSAGTTRITLGATNTITGNADVTGGLTAGTADAFSVSSTGVTNIAITDATAFRVQNTSAADTMFTVDTAARGAGGGNRIKIGNDTGSDTNVTILQVDSAAADITSNLSVLNGGLFYNTTSNSLKAIVNGAVDEICTFAAGNCAGAGAGVTQSGTNANGQVAYFTSGNNITSSANFLFDGTNIDVGGSLTVGTANAAVIAADGNITTAGDLAVNGGDITSTGALNITPGGALTVGVATQTATIQGTTVAITSNGAGNDITVTSADQIILNSVGTIELQDSTNITGDFTVSGNTTLGDAAGDTLTINGTAVSIPNNLNIGSDALFIDAANQRIGVGTDTPQFKIHAVEDGNALFFTGETYAASGGTIFQGRAANGTQALPTALTQGNLISQFSGRGYDGTAFTGTRVAITMNAVGTWSGTNNGTEISFYTTPENTTTLTRQMYIDSTGNVAFGASNPTSPFGGKVVHVQNSSGNSSLYLSSSAGGAAMLILGDGSAKWHIENDSNDFFSLTQSGVAQRFSIDTDGNVGIGIYNATARLHVQGEAGGTADALIANNNTGTGNIFVAQDNGSAVFTIADGGNVTMTGDLAVNGGDITSTGALNITPGGALTVGATGQTATIQGTVTTITSNGAGNDIILSSADTIELQGATNVTGSLTVSVNADIAGTLFVGTGDAFQVDASGNITTSGDAAINGGDITSTGALNITPGGALTVGVTGQTALLQGSTVSITSNGAGNDVTVTSADQIILNSVGTIELQDNTNVTGNFTVSGNGDVAGYLYVGSADQFQVDASGNTQTSGTLQVGGLATLNGGFTATRTLGADSGTTQNVGNIGFTTPADTTGTNTTNGLNITPTIGDATGGTNTANIINIANTTGDAQVSLNAVNIGTLTGTAANEYALNIGSGWDSVLRVGGTEVINGSGQVVSTQINGTLFNTSADSGSDNIARGDTLAIQGGTNGIDTSLTGDTYTLNLDYTEINDATFGTGSGFTWTYDVGAVDPTIAFASDLVTLTAASTVLSGDLAVNGGDITSTGALNITPGGALTVGVATQTATIQGTTVAITSNGAGNDITVTSADQIILNSVGTIELQDSTNITGNLDVSGTITGGSADQFNVDASGNITTSGDAAINGGDITSTGALNITPGGALTVGVVSQTTTIQGTATTITSNGAGNDISITASDQVLMSSGSSIELQSNTNITGNLTVSGNTTLGDAAGDTLTINGTAVSIPNNLNFDSNTLFIDATSNNIGIGAAANTYKLFINAGAAGGLNVTSSSYNVISADATNNAYGYFRSVNTSDSVSRFEIGSYDINGASQGGRDLVLNPLGGNVAVGNEGTPAYLLTVGTGDLSGITSTGAVGIKTAGAAPTGDLSFGVGANRTINVLSQTTANTAGNNLSLQAATGNGTGAGGSLQLTAGIGGGTAGVGGDVLIQGGAAGAGGTTSGSVIVRSNVNNKTTAFQIQQADSTVVLNVDTVNTRITIGAGAGTLANRNLDVAVAQITNQLRVGGATNYIETNASTGQLRFAGTARNSKTISLMPEFAGAVLTGDGSNNTGTMTSDFCSNGTLVINVSGSNCASGESRNYYQWTAQATNDYDVWVRWQVPSDFDGWAASNPIQFYGWRSSSSAGTSVTMTIYSESGTVCGTATSISNTTTWSATNYTSSGCSTTAGSTLIIRVTLSVGVNNEIARIGEIKLNYLSNF